MDTKVRPKSKAGAKPGERRGGRVKGTPNRKNAAVIAAIEASGITPLEFMLRAMREPIPDDLDPAVKVARINLQFEAAKAAAPYVHPRLSAIAHSGPNGGPISLEVSFGKE